jgi:ADP-dependent phosphofructokinase/glucokinase
MKLKKKYLNYTKEFKTKNNNKKINFIFDWRVKLKNNSQKNIKKIKITRIKIEIRNTNNILIEWWNYKEKLIQQKVKEN